MIRNVAQSTRPKLLLQVHVRVCMGTCKTNRVTVVFVCLGTKPPEKEGGSSSGTIHPQSQTFCVVRMIIEAEQ